MKGLESRNGSTRKVSHWLVINLLPAAASSSSFALRSQSWIELLPAECNWMELWDTLRLTTLLGGTKNPANTANCSIGILWFHEVFKIWWILVIKGFVCEGKDFKFWIWQEAREEKPRPQAYNFSCLFLSELLLHYFRPAL